MVVGATAGGVKPRKSAAFTSDERTTDLSSSPPQSLNLEEFAAEVHKLVGDLSPEEISVLYDQADENKDGTVQWEEFTNWVMNGKFCAAKKREAESGYESDASTTKLSKGRDASSIENAQEKQFAAELELAHQLEAFLKTDYEEELNAAPQPASKPEYRGSTTTQSAGIISYPYTVEMGKNLLVHFTEGKKLDYASAQELMTHFREERAVTNAIQEISVPEDGKLYIVGDTHGHFEDVLYIFHQYGVPSLTNVYLFNGDIADRGVRACEIFFVLFVFSLACPGSLYFNRGNHENELMNRSDRAWGGGFYDEVAKKYDWAMYDEFQKIFTVLGLCSIINDGDRKVFVVHGGLCRIKEITLKYLSEIKLNLCTAPHPTSTSVRDQVFSDLLWSDPQPENGKQVSARGLGILWGPDVTKKFLSSQRIEYMVRSHECPANNEGFKIDHSNRCVTVFSASDYLARGNYACVVVFNSSLEKDSMRKFEIRKHFAPPLEFFQDLMQRKPDSDWSKECFDYKQKFKDIMESTRCGQELIKMKTFLILYKPEIYADLLELKQNEELKVTEDIFVNVCTFHINEEFNWTRALQGWNAIDGDGNIHFATFLNRFHIRLSNEKYSGFKYEAVKKMYETFIQMDLDIEETIKIFDKNNDGFVDFEELTTVLKEYDLGLSDSQTTAIARSIFVSQSGDTKKKGDGPNKLKVDEFLERFSVVYRSNKEEEEAGKVSRNDVLLGFLGGLLMSKECTKQLIEEENAARKIQEIARKKQGGKAEATKKEGGIVQKGLNLVSSMRQTKASLTEKLQRFFMAADQNQDGLVDLNEFVETFARIPGIFNLTTPWGEPVTKEVLLQGAKAIDVDGSGSVNYLEFLGGFQPRDTQGDLLLDDLYENICTMLFRHNQAIRAGCTYLDRSKCGKITSQKFMDVLRGINRTLSRPSQPFRESQIRSVCENCSSDGMVDYIDFLQSFVLSDSANLEADQVVNFDR